MELFYIALSILFLCNLIVSILIVRRSDLEQFQKVGQVIIIWLIPFIGCIGLWLFNRSHDDVITPSEKFGSGPAKSISNVDASLGSD